MMRKKKVFNFVRFKINLDKNLVIAEKQLSRKIKLLDVKFILILRKEIIRRRRE